MNKDVIKIKKITVKPIRQTTFDQAQFWTPLLEQTQNLQNPANIYEQPVAQSTHLENVSPYTTHLQNAANQVQQLSMRTDPSIIELFNQQEDIQRDTNTLISKFSDLQASIKMTVSYPAYRCMMKKVIDLF